MIQTIINKNGITIKQLKELVKHLPEKDEYGDDFEVWVMSTDGTKTSSTSIAKSIINIGNLIINIDV